MAEDIFGICGLPGPQAVKESNSFHLMVDL